MADLLPVAFHGDTLSLVEHNGEPFAAIKPICDAIGLDWTAQHAKLTGAGFRWNTEDIPTVAADGKTRIMVCLPMRKLSGWLASISAAKVKPEIRDKLIAYQDECDDALWRYWSEGHASRPGTPTQARLDLIAPLPRPRAADLPKLCTDGWHGDRVSAGIQQLESAAGVLRGRAFVKDRQTQLDLLTAAHMQCQAASLFIANHYDEVSGHA